MTNATPDGRPPAGSTRALVIALVLAGSVILALGGGLGWALASRPTTTDAAGAQPADRTTGTADRASKPTPEKPPSSPKPSVSPTPAVPAPEPQPAPPFSAGEAPPAPAAPQPPEVTCPTGRLEVQIVSLTSNPTATVGLWSYDLTGTVTNGYTHGIAVSDLTPPAILGLDATGYERTRFSYGKYDRGGAPGSGMITLASGETIGFHFSDSGRALDPATIAEWIVTPVPETGMLAIWSSDWEAITRACGNPGGWHF